MLSRIKTFILNVIAGANIVSVILMLMVGYSYYLSPNDYPLFACMGMIFPFVVAFNLLFIPIWVFLSWRRLLIPVIGLLLAYVPIRIYLPLHGHTTPSEDAICIVSYNVCQYGGNFKYEGAFDSIYNYLKERKADIVCLQEDLNSKWKNSLERYAGLFPYNDTTIVSTNSKGAINSVGIHTRFPILKKEVIDYESPTNGSVAYYLNINGDTVIVINSHLESTHLNTSDRTRYTDMIENNKARDMLENEKTRDTMKAETRDLLGKLTLAMQIRARHVEVVHQYIEAHSHYPIISCGDFNDTPLSYAHYVMAKGLTDCYVETGRGPGLSYNRKGFNLRIDHLMCSSHFEPIFCEIDDKIDVSDHYPLLCWLKMREKP